MKPSSKKRCQFFLILIHLLVPISSLPMLTTPIFLSRYKAVKNGGVTPLLAYLPKTVIKITGNTVEVSTDDQTVSTETVDDPLEWIEEYKSKINVPEIQDMPRFNDSFHIVGSSPEILLMPLGDDPISNDDFNNDSNNDPNNPYWGFWATIGFGLLIFIVFSFVQSIALITYGLYLENWNTNIDIGRVISSLIYNGNAISLAEIPSAATSIGLIALFASLRPQLNVTQYLQLYKPQALTLLKWLGVMALVIILLEISNILLEKENPEFMTKVYNSTTNLPLLWIAVIIAAPFFEEFFFRGFLLEGIRHSPVGTIGAILITSFTWAMMHMQYGWFEIATIFLIGILFSIAKLKTQSLYIPIAMHAFMNLTASVLMALTTEETITALPQ
ncbi:putative 24 protein [Nymphon striatum]|nr:putative 24 protein [Nymphon striatum]